MIIISKGIIKKNQLDSNKHLNVSEYIKCADKQNSELLKDFKKKNFYFVAKKTFIENKLELLLKEKYKIRSFLIKINKIYLITRHEIYNLNKKKISSICNFFLIPLNKKNKKIFEMSTEEINKLKKKIKKNYHNPF